MSKPNASAESELDALRAELGERDREASTSRSLESTRHVRGWLGLGIDASVPLTAEQGDLWASILKDGE